MALRARKVSGAFEKRPPGVQISTSEFNVGKCNAVMDRAGGSRNTRSRFMLQKPG